MDRLVALAAAMSLTAFVGIAVANAEGPSTAAPGSPDQTLEIPSANNPTPSPGSGSSASTSGTWSDGSNTYTWKDESPDANESVAPEASLPQPSYGDIEDYMNQQMQAEAMGPAFSPLVGMPMPYMVDPYLFYGNGFYTNGFYGNGIYTPSYIPPPVISPPRPWVPPPPPHVGKPPPGVPHKFTLH